jgi:hypothetical protein
MAFVITFAKHPGAFFEFGYGIFAIPVGFGLLTQ